MTCFAFSILQSSKQKRNCLYSSACCDAKCCVYVTVLGLFTLNYSSYPAELHKIFPWKLLADTAVLKFILKSQFPILNVQTRRQTDRQTDREVSRPPPPSIHLMLSVERKRNNLTQI